MIGKKKYFVFLEEDLRVKSNPTVLIPRTKGKLKNLIL